MNLASQKYMKLDPKWFKAFIAVSEYGTLSVAAQHSAQSVSVVSEHLTKIRDTIGFDVLVKVHDNYQLTDVGQQLHDYIRKIMDLSADFHDGLAAESQTMEGMVRYAMPHSCLQSPHFPMLLQRRRDFPGIELTVELCPTEVVTRSILQGRFDFGFVTDVVSHPNLEYIRFCEEEYVMVSASGAPLKDLSCETLADCHYISYPGMNTCFDLWIRHHHPQEKKLSALGLYHAGEINEIVGAIKMVAGGLGISVFPRHVVESYLASGELIEVIPDSDTPAMNSIYITRRKDVTPSKRVDAVVQWFRDMHPEYQ